MEASAGVSADDLRILALLREQVADGVIDAALVDEFEKHLISPDRRETPGVTS